MSDRPTMLKRGDRARLFPVLADTSRENRIASIFLSILPVVPELSEQVFASLGVRVGKRTRIETFTEIVLNDNSDMKNRPDGLIVLSTGKKTWTALVEAKIGKAELAPEQVTRYIDVAKANGIDAVVTISNQFVTRADQSPINLPKTTLKKADLFHWSWTWISTQCAIIAASGNVDDVERAFLLSEFMRFLDDPGTGVERFSQMNSGWKDVVQSVAHQEKLSRNAGDVDDTARAWHSELRDLSLQLSRLVGQPVTIKLDRRLMADGTERLKQAIDHLVIENELRATFVVPDGAANIDLTADLARKAIAVGMKIKAPLDKKTTKARVNWLLRMLKEDDPRLFVRAHWPGRKPMTQKELTVLRDSPDEIDGDGSGAVPHSFEVVLIEPAGKRFAGRRTFIEDLERAVPEFYHLVGQNLRAWQAPPLKPVRPHEEYVEEVLKDVSSPDAAE